MTDNPYEHANRYLAERHPELMAEERRIAQSRWNDRVLNGQLAELKEAHRIAWESTRRLFDCSRIGCGDRGASRPRAVLAKAKARGL